MKKIVEEIIMKKNKQKETIQKEMGQWMTPDDIVTKMLDFAPQEWFSNNILEPTAGDGQIVIQILNRKIEYGMTPQEAIDTTFMNELDNNYYNKLVERISNWCSEHNCSINENNIKNEDARYIDYNSWIGDFNIISNLPFSSWANSRLTNQIINSLSDHHSVYLTKWSTGCYKKYVPHVKKFENIVFPGILFDTLLWEYDPEYTEGDIWIYWPTPKFPKHKLKKEYTKAGQTDEV